jgi:hypothetical protein
MDLFSETPNDFNLKYRDCVCYLSQPKEESELFLIENISDTGKTLHGYTSKKGQWTTKTVRTNNVDLDFHMPDLGLINFKGYVLNVVRRATKQYRRGFTWKNGVITFNVIEEMLPHYLGKGTAINKTAALVEQIFDPIYFSVEHGLNLLLSGERQTVALNNRYYLSMSTKLPYIYLGFANGNVIGRVNENTGRCTLFASAAPLLEDVSTIVNVR